MTALLVLTAVLLLVAGMVKLRAAERVGLGVTVLPLVEILAALALGVTTFLAPLSPSGGLKAVLASVALIVVSSLHVGAAIRKRTRTRELSEGARLRTYVQYLSQAPDPDVPGRSSFRKDPEQSP